MNDVWLFLFAHNAEGSRSLDREVTLLPRLAPTLSMPIPNIEFIGRQQDNAFAFVGYRKIAGIPLTQELLLELSAGEQEQCARELGGFLMGMHSFDMEEARRSGVVEAPYPFSRTEEGIRQGSAPELYRRELARLLTYPNLDGNTRQFCTDLVDRILTAYVETDPLTLIHGDLSGEHILFSPEERCITGVIDFTDVIISSPLLDFMYLNRTYGRPFLDLISKYYSLNHTINCEQISEQVQRLTQWHAALRLLWTLDYNYTPGIQPSLLALHALQTGEAI